MRDGYKKGTGLAGGQVSPHSSCASEGRYALQGLPTYTQTDKAANKADPRVRYSPTRINDSEEKGYHRNISKDAMFISGALAN